MAHLEVRTPDRTRILEAPGTPLLPLTEVLRREGLPLNVRCGGRGLCDGCAVEVIAGRVAKLSSGAEVAGGAVRACQHAAGGLGDATIAIPARSLLAEGAHALVDFSLRVPHALAPLVPAGVGALGAAIDVGTTTVAVMLVDLADGRVLARAAEFNRQMALGDDVLTRIHACSEGPHRLAALQRAVAVETIAPLLVEVLAVAGASPSRLRCCTVAGNTTMLHLLAGVDPTPMGAAPFPPAFTDHRVLTPSRDVPGWPAGAAGEAPMHLLPSASAYVGADLVAGALASGLLYDEGRSLLVDVGTNGEMILKVDGGVMLGAATAAGPAFEGAGLSCGMRAAEGAVSHLTYADDRPEPHVELIGHGPARGLCGSAYIDLLAEGRRAGLLTETGRFTAGPPLHVAADVTVTEADVARLLTAKAAVAAGVLTLLGRAGLASRDVRRVYLAGGFGNHMRPASAIACGLLPGFAAEQIEGVGNSALAGAYLAMVDGSVLPELARAARQIEVVELNLDPRFEGLYIDHLRLP